MPRPYDGGPDRVGRGEAIRELRELIHEGDRELRDLRDLGIPYVAVQNPWHGYEFDAATTGRWGEIYLGESDRISHLFIYFPPVG